MPRNTSLNSKLHDLGFIVFRNLFLLTNAIIFSVVALLFFLGAIRAAIFLGIISIVNISLGLAQDIHAWLALGKLQSLTSPTTTRQKKDGSTEIIPTDDININDIIFLKNGDQVPCDGTLINASTFEINEGLITGESNSLSRKNGDHLLAGSVVTAGLGTMRILSLPNESRIERMTAGIKKYSINASRIQHSAGIIIKYAGYILIVILAFVVLRGFITRQATVELVLSVAALTSVVVPQGLVFAITLFFAYGAAHLFRKNVLLQEINATEKLGRIKNLCMDKTGTLTENFLTVEAMYLPPKISRGLASELTSAYLDGTNDSSQTIEAVRKFLNHDFGGKIVSALAFSSWRQFGAVIVKNNDDETCVLAGAPSVFLNQLKNADEKKWLEKILRANSVSGKSIVMIARSKIAAIPEQLSEAQLSTVAVFVFFNNLREGISDTISFFQNREVKIRIISGDNLATTAAVAAAAGIRDYKAGITGGEMTDWSDKVYAEKAKNYSIFAEIVPEQKEKIIEALKKSGFTAMVGDGANDALAIKKADLGIAMFDGAPATRQLASVILTNNSFAALPGGVELADSIIRNIEIFASIFLNQSFLGLFFFLIIAVTGFSFPLTPFNITLINYCAVAMPGVLISYWTIRPTKKTTRRSEKSFLKTVVPFAFAAAIIQALGAAMVFALNVWFGLAVSSGTLVLLTFSILGYLFFCLTPRVFNGRTTSLQKKQLALFALVEILMVTIIFKTPFLFSFFNIGTLPSSRVLLIALVAVVGLAGVGEYLLAERLALTP